MDGENGKMTQESSVRKYLTDSFRLGVGKNTCPSKSYNVKGNPVSSCSHARELLLLSTKVHYSLFATFSCVDF